MAVWTGYVVLLGAGLLLIPNVILSVFRIEETDEAWIRIVGLLLIGYGAYYWTAIQPRRRSAETGLSPALPP
jgi:hypothetical protein